MARTILEDYYHDTESHFELAYKIPQRAREIQRSGSPMVEARGDKPIVVALREISERPSRYEGDGAADMDGAAAMADAAEGALSADAAQGEQGATAAQAAPKVSVDASDVLSADATDAAAAAAKLAQDSDGLPPEKR